ncbi:MobA/MobL family protein [Bradyrhizobium sp. AS23.2]|uniref:MobA/MobL family protein n=1 Tax=Bradyrhizobium sp. AS23.2 TaxID=1680155 RepID=UPI00093B8C54|nr:MobA/MobL family protein [Bradyrhizobium sp. AS23.2]
MPFCSIHFGVVPTSQNYTAIARFAYQTCSAAADRFRSVDYQCYAGFHVGGCVLLPPGVPLEFAQWENFYKMAAFRETRRNAQDGRILDFALPRAVPRELLLPLAAFTLLPFVQLGMAVRLDVECVPASDDKPNPHAHAWLAQRELEQDGFGLKERTWNTLFRRDGGRYVRALVAARLTLGCAILGVDAYVDPRRNDERGAGIPEQRLPRVAIKKYNEGRHVHEFEQLKASRRLKRAREAPTRSPEPEAANLTVTNAAVDRLVDEEAAKLRRRFAAAAEEAGYALEGNVDAARGLPTLSLTGTSVTFDGWAFRITPTGTSEDAAIITRFVRQLDWPALVIEGGPRLADVMAIAAADEDVFMINRAPSAAARDIISLAFLSELKAAIARHDPLGVAAEFLADFEANTAGVQVDVPEPPMQVDAASAGYLQSAADLVSANIVPFQPGKVAETAFALPSILTTSGKDARAVSTDSDVKQTVGAPSEAIEVMESLPDGNSWKIGPDPAKLAQTALFLQSYADRQRQDLESVDESIRRMHNRSSGLRSVSARPPPRR